MSALFGLFVVAALIGLIPAAIAQSKGRDFGTWWIYGAALFIFALVHSLLLQPSQGATDRKAIELGNLKCPHCAEWIKREAKVCRFCGRDVESPIGSERSRAAGKSEPEPDAHFLG